MLSDLGALRIEDFEPDALDRADELGQQLIRLIRLITRVRTHFAASQKDGIESAAYALLARLVLDGPQRTTALADAVHSDISTVSRQSAALVRHGLVERRPDPEDGRACLLAATPEGLRVFDYNRKQRNAHIALTLSSWDQAEIAALTGLLSRFNTDFEAYRTTLLGERRESHPVATAEGGSNT